MKTYRTILAIGLILLTLSCTNKDNYIDNKFAGTEFTYEFKKDRTYKFTGHWAFEDLEYKGRYTISDNIIFLIPDYDSHLFRGLLKPTLKIIDSQCLRDNDNNFYCTDNETVKKLDSVEYKFQEETVSILDTLQAVREERDLLENRNYSYRKKHKTGPIVSDLFVDYGGIIVVDRREFHLFQYVKTDSSYRSPRQYLLRLLVSKKPFEIYRLYDLQELLRTYL